jgi:hypothetical protein
MKKDLAESCSGKYRASRAGETGAVVPNPTGFSFFQEKPTILHKIAG